MCVSRVTFPSNDACLESIQVLILLVSEEQGMCHCSILLCSGPYSCGIMCKRQSRLVTDAIGHCQRALSRDLKDVTCELLQPIKGSGFNTHAFSCLEIKPMELHYRMAKQSRREP